MQLMNLSDSGLRDVQYIPERGTRKGIAHSFELAWGKAYRRTPSITTRRTQGTGRRCMYTRVPTTIFGGKVSIAAGEGTPNRGRTRREGVKILVVYVQVV